MPVRPNGGQVPNNRALPSGPGSRYDISDWNGDDVDEHGEFAHLYFDRYWTDPDSHPFLIRHAGRWAGFALVRAEGVNDMAEFFVMRKYRRAGVGREAARRVFAPAPAEPQPTAQTAAGS